MAAGLGAYTQTVQGLQEEDREKQAGVETEGGAAVRLRGDVQSQEPGLARCQRAMPHDGRVARTGWWR